MTKPQPKKKKSKLEDSSQVLEIHYQIVQSFTGLWWIKDGKEEFVSNCCKPQNQKHHHVQKNLFFQF